MSDLSDLYQELIIDHGMNPHNYKVLPQANCVKDGFNPLCGDRLTLYLQVNQQRVVAASFQGAGCAISIASASLMTEALKGKTIDEVQAMFHEFQEMLTTHVEVKSSRLGKLLALQGVREFPMRVKCATLAWHTAIAAVQHEPGAVSTE